MEHYKNKKALDRYLSPVDAWAMAFGCAVGWGALVMPGTTFLPVAGPAGTVIAMIIGMAIMLVIGACFIYLMTRSTRTGGVYTFAKEAFGRDHAFVCAWFLCLSYMTVIFLNGSALFVVIRTLLGSRHRAGTYYEIAGNQVSVMEVVLSIVALVAVGLLFIVAKPLLQKMQTILAIVMAAGVILTVIFCLPHVPLHEVTSSFGTMGLGKAYGITGLVILMPWAFVGFEIISFDIAHFKFSVRKTKWVIVAAILFSGFVYIALTLVSIAAVPDGFSSWQEYIRKIGTQSGVSSVATFQAAKAIIGTPGLVIMTVTAFAAILTGMIGGYRAVIRMLSTMAEDRILSERFNRTTYSIIFIMVLSVLISLLGRNTLTWFVDITSFGAIAAYGYTTASTYKIARIENNRKMYMTGIIGTIVALVFITVQIVPGLSALDVMGSEAFLLLSLWCLLGFVFYWWTVWRSELTEYSGLSVSGIVLFALLVYSAIMWLGKLLMRKDTVEATQSALIKDGIIMIVIIFAGLLIMLYIQDLVRKKHEAIEREKIRAVEGSLAKSRFLFNMSHDIRTPMNAIIGYTDLALKESSVDEIHNHLSKISSSSHHLLALINDILEMSRIESGKADLEYAPEDLNGIFDGMRDLFSEQMKEKNIDYAVHTSHVRDPYVWCDRKNLNRVLLNLISNSYKFTDEGGKISVTLAETGITEDGYGAYEIRVQDNGIGMSKDFVEKMFNAFERERTSTDSGVEGTGLGLSITKSIVDLMGGTIEVLTSPGSGTEIIIRLKLRLADESEITGQDEKKKKINEDDFDFTGKRALLVEDNLINMEIAKTILSQKGFEVDTAENGQIAVDMLTGAEAGHYDVVLMDIQMPVMDGYAATKAIRASDNKELAEIPIIAMTANAFKEDQEAVIGAGMNAHIAKPIDVGLLFSTLNDVLS
ncbi:MAG: amino acid permease [Firmicutes bacterium]|nr:amino acid permease [Bacillota bacterium]